MEGGSDSLLGVVGILGCSLWVLFLLCYCRGWLLWLLRCSRGVFWWLFCRFWCLGFLLWRVRRVVWGGVLVLWRVRYSCWWCRWGRSWGWLRGETYVSYVCWKWSFLLFLVGVCTNGMRIIRVKYSRFGRGEYLPQFFRRVEETLFPFVQSRIPFLRDYSLPIHFWNL